MNIAITAVLISVLDKLSNQSMLKRILWRARIADKISETYRSLSEAIRLFDVSSFDVTVRH